MSRLFKETTFSPFQPPVMELLGAVFVSLMSALTYSNVFLMFTFSFIFVSYNFNDMLWRDSTVREDTVEFV